MNTFLGIDFTNSLSDFHRFSAFDETVISFIRSNLQIKSLVVVDTCWGMPKPEISVAKDHINLTGNNPLVGANPDCGDRFFKMTDLYITKIGNLPELTVAGIKIGEQPNSEELTKLKAIGADCWSYNLVSTAIVAAHAKRQVLGLLIPPEIKLDYTIWADLKPFIESAFA